jgi:hypothetical protein
MARSVCDFIPAVGRNRAELGYIAPMLAPIAAVLMAVTNPTDAEAITAGVAKIVAMRYSTVQRVIEYSIEHLGMQIEKVFVSSELVRLPGPLENPR